MRYHTVPLVFVALHEYKPKSSTVLGVSVSVLTSCVELTPSNIARPSLNQVILARGFAYTAHFMVVPWPIHDLTTALEEALLLNWGLSNDMQNETLNKWSYAIISFNISTEAALVLITASEAKHYVTLSKKIGICSSRPTQDLSAGYIFVKVASTKPS